MANGESGSDNTVLYIVVGIVLLGAVSICCVGAGAAFFVMRTDDADDAPPPVSVAEPVVPATTEVVLTPPPSLNLYPTPTSDRRTRHIEATVTLAEGTIGVSVGDRCSFDVTVLDRSGPPGFYCRTFAECNGVHLFGQDYPRRNGFFPCELYDVPLGVAGEDLETTGPAGTGDPMFQIDSRDHHFMAADDEHGMVGQRYRIIARIDTITPR